MNYFGATFREHPQWRNDGVITVVNESTFSSLVRINDQRKAIKKPKKVEVKEMPLEIKARLRRQEQLMKQVEKLRQRDEMTKDANLDRHHAARQTRFLKMFNSLTEDSECVQDVNHHIELDEKLKINRQRGLYTEWLEGVYNPIQLQINQAINPIGNIRASTPIMIPKADPVKRDLQRTQAEDRFSVTTDRLLFEHSPDRPPLASLSIPHYPTRHCR